MDQTDEFSAEKHTVQDEVDATSRAETLTRMLARARERRLASGAGETNPDGTGQTAPLRNDLATEQASESPCELINRDELARRLGLSPRTIARMVARGELPEPCLSQGKRPRWLWSYVLEFLEKRHRRLSELNRRQRSKLEHS